MWTVALCVTALLCGVYGQLDPVTISTSDLSGQVGETVYFSCDIQASDRASGVALEFYDNGAFFGFDDSRVMRNNSGSIAFFSFGPLTAEDNGTVLRCSGAVGQQDPSDTAVISVTFPPVITRISPMNDTIVRREGEAVTVMLNVTGNPRPQYTWTRDGGSLPTNGVTATLKSITFNRTSRNHSGMYRLVANNSAGNDSHSFTLDVQYPPEFVGEPYTPGTVNCTRDGTTFECAAYPGTPMVIFNCAADGNPGPTVQISPPPRPLNTNTDNNVITISDVVRNNSGLYSCSAASGEYNVTQTFRFYVGGLASPVSNVVPLTMEGRVSAAWMYNNAANDVPGTYFIVTVLQDGTQIGDPREFPITQTNVTLSDLVGGQTYTIQVAVRNLQGVSDAISSQQFTFSSTIAVSVSNLLTLLVVVGVMFALL